MPGDGPIFSQENPAKHPQAGGRGDNEYLDFRDAGAPPHVPGRLQRNGRYLMWHDGQNQLVVSPIGTYDASGSITLQDGEFLMWVNELVLGDGEELIVEGTAEVVIL